MPKTVQIRVTKETTTMTTTKVIQSMWIPVKLDPDLSSEEFMALDFLFCCCHDTHSSQSLPVVVTVFINEKLNTITA